MPDRLLHVARLGCVPYGDALALQREVAGRVIAREIEGDVLLLLEHPPVVTLGRSSKLAHLVASRELLSARGVELFEVERGGDVTFHGPGQLVGYPILDLKAAPHRRDLHWYLRSVEEALILALRSVGIQGNRSAGHTGVWVGANGGAPDARGANTSRKIASIGVHARDWVTWHGFAINVTTELSYFDLIVPCGIQGVTMTSIARERPDQRADVGSFLLHVIEGFADTFSLSWTSNNDLALDRLGTSAPR